MSALILCSRCECHVRPDEAVCPHCGARRRVSRRRGAAALIAGLGAAATVALAPACAYGVGVTPDCNEQDGGGGAGGAGGGDPCDVADAGDGG